MKNQLQNESRNTFIELYSKEPIGKNLIFIEVVKEYIENTLNFELGQIKNQNARIKIISLEKKLEYNLTIKNQNVKLKGIIDRIDMFNDEVRISFFKVNISISYRFIIFNYLIYGNKAIINFLV